jgi:hypothetical protein
VDIDVYQRLAARMLADGGLADRPGGAFRVDATLWGVLALRGAESSKQFVQSACIRLAAEQGNDGRVAIDKLHPASYWPTPLAILAWHHCLTSREAVNRAVRFLLNTAGEHYPNTPDAPGPEDTSLRGWPWVADTYSWVVPTSLSVMALRVTGHGADERVREAVKLLLDRQLPHGGWNSGNTIIFGRELHPNPECTGAALNALAGVIDRSVVGKSIEYLQGELERLCTPIDLGWALLGLGSWRQWPRNAGALVERCLGKQSRYGTYDTAALSVLLLGALGAQYERAPLLDMA